MSGRNVSALGQETKFEVFEVAKAQGTSCCKLVVGAELGSRHNFSTLRDELTSATHFNFNGWLKVALQLLWGLSAEYHLLHNPRLHQARGHFWSLLYVVTPTCAHGASGAGVEGG